MSYLTSAMMVPHPPIILPGVGHCEEKKIADIDQAYRAAASRLMDSAPDTVIIISPHAPSYYDYIQLSAGRHARGSMAQFADPQDRFDIPYDVPLIREISRLAQEENFPAGTLGRQEQDLDHGTMVPLYYLKDLPETTQFIRIGLGGLDYAAHYHLGQLIAKAAQNLNRKIAVVGSGDLSHCQKADSSYGYRECGPAYDQQIMEIMSQADFEKLLAMPESQADEAMVCGHKSFCVMAGVMDGLKPQVSDLAHSAAFGVGYGVASYHDFQLDETRQYYEEALEKKKQAYAAQTAREDPYVQLARQSVNAYIQDHKILSDSVPAAAEITEPAAGAFVSLHKNGQLRGCIGTIAPTKETLAREIIDNAIAACSRDHRFPAVQPWELMDLEINVDVLQPAQTVHSLDELDPRKYGVIVSKRGRRGLLLPDLEGVDTVEQQLAIAKQKAGLNPQEEGCQIQRFEVVRHV